MQEIGARKYLECSALIEKGVEDIFHEAARLALSNSETLIVSINKMLSFYFQTLSYIARRKLHLFFCHFY